MFVFAKDAALSNPVSRVQNQLMLAPEPQDDPETEDEDITTESGSEHEEPTLHRTLAIVRDYGLKEEELLWRLKEAIGVEAVVFWMKKIENGAIVEGEEMLHKVPP